MHGGAGEVDARDPGACRSSSRPEGSVADAAGGAAAGEDLGGSAVVVEVAGSADSVGEEGLEAAAVAPAGKEDPND